MLVRLGRGNPRGSSPAISQTRAAATPLPCTLYSSEGLQTACCPGQCSCPTLAIWPLSLLLQPKEDPPAVLLGCQGSGGDDRPTILRLQNRSPGPQAHPRGRRWHTQEAPTQPWSPWDRRQGAPPLPWLTRSGLGLVVGTRAPPGAPAGASLHHHQGQRMTRALAQTGLEEREEGSAVSLTRSDTLEGKSLSTEGISAPQTLLARARVPTAVQMRASAQPAAWQRCSRVGALRPVRSPAPGPPTVGS